LSEKEKKNLLVVYRQGSEIFINPDFHLQLPGILRLIKDGRPLEGEIKLGHHILGWGILPEYVWIEFVRELIEDLVRYEENPQTKTAAAIDVIESIIGSSSPELAWKNAKEAILDRIDVLSGWNTARYRQGFANEAVTRENGHYYTKVGGQICEVLGRRTEIEERWDYIAESCTRNFGALRVLLQALCLHNICLDFSQQPDIYPKGIVITLQEINGQPHYLNWGWYIPGPYQRKWVPWTPHKNTCDINWLSFDLLAEFAGKEKIPGEELTAGKLENNRSIFEDKCKGYQFQFDLVVDSPHRIGEGEDSWFNFRGNIIRWVNGTVYSLPVVVIPCRGRPGGEAEYKVALEFLSLLAFNKDLPIKVLYSCGGPLSYQPLACQPRTGEANILTGADQTLWSKKDFISQKENLAFGLYREGLSGGSVYYSFLSYYKIIQLAFNENGKLITVWINQSLTQLQNPFALKRVSEIKGLRGDVVSYLFEDGRCAIAHVKNKPIANPNEPSDLSRLSSDLDLIKELARLAIKQNLFC
jgi:hypothetical protein